MSELRKPHSKILLEIQGKKNKIELFKKADFEKLKKNEVNKYRMRINGKWYPKGSKCYYTKWEFRDLLFRSIDL